MPPTIAKLETSTTLNVPRYDITEEFIRKALNQADVNSLRLALYQITEDKELEVMQVNRPDFRGGAAVGYIVSKEDEAKVRAKALDFLLKGPQSIPSLPTKEESHRLMDLFSDVPMKSNEALSFNYDEGLEELALEEFPPDFKWSSRSPPSVEVLRTWKVVVVGAGISGIAAAVYLKRMDILFEVIERQDTIEGIWLLNNYPYVRVDSPFSAFQYKFVKTTNGMSTFHQETG